MVEVSEDSYINYRHGIVFFYILFLSTSYVYACVYYSHIVTDLSFIFFTLLKCHFCLHSLTSRGEDGKELFSVLAVIRITLRAP